MALSIRELPNEPIGVYTFAFLSSRRLRTAAMPASAQPWRARAAVAEVRDAFVAPCQCAHRQTLERRQHHLPVGRCRDRRFHGAPVGYVPAVETARRPDPEGREGFPRRLLQVMWPTT